jgi:hypothetical protein
MPRPSHTSGGLKVLLYDPIYLGRVRNSPSFQGSIDYGHYVIELHACRHTADCTFATFIYEKIQQRLLWHITGTDENEVIRQALVWCEKE